MAGLIPPGEITVWGVPVILTNVGGGYEVRLSHAPHVRIGWIARRHGDRWFAGGSDFVLPAFSGFDRWEDALIEVVKRCTEASATSKPVASKRLLGYRYTDPVSKQQYLLHPDDVAVVYEDRVGE